MRGSRSPTVHRGADAWQARHRPVNPTRVLGSHGVHARGTQRMRGRDRPHGCAACKPTSCSWSLHAPLATVHAYKAAGQGRASPGRRRGSVASRVLTSRQQEGECGACAASVGGTSKSRWTHTHPHVAPRSTGMCSRPQSKVSAQRCARFVGWGLLAGAAIAYGGSCKRIAHAELSKMHTFGRRRVAPPQVSAAPAGVCA